MSRKNTPDIMGNLMTGATVSKETQEESVKAINIENNKELIQKTSTMANSIGNTAINHESVKEIKQTMGAQPKEKTTFNLSLSTLEELEDLWMRLRKKLKGEQRITKTLIVEKAIEMAINDFESKSELSELYKRLKEG
jgi:hypothetical protein